MITLVAVLIAITTSEDSIMGDWVLGSSNLPLPLSNAYITHYEHTIFILGGSNCNDCTPHIEYDIETDSFTRYPSDFPISLSARGQSAAPQIDSKLFMLATLSPYIHIYDLKTKTLAQDQIQIPIKTYSGSWDACLTGNNDNLYVVGGYDTTFLATLLIYSLADNRWINGPQMNIRRASGSCIITQNNILYSIAGDPWDAGNTVEYIAITDVQNNDWMLTNNDLTQRVRSAQSILYGDFIFVLGGYGGGFTDKIHIIDTITNEISLSSKTLVYPVESAMAIGVDDIIYAFGGSNAPNVYDTWQYTTMDEIGNSVVCDDTYLTQLSPAVLSVHSKFYVNEWYDDHTREMYASLTMGDGNSYDQFIVLHTSSNDYFVYVIYELNGEYETFTAVIGMENDNVCVAQNVDGIEYKFYLDDILVYESQQLIQHQYKDVNIDVSNANKLRIEVYRGETNWCDHATIANPVLTCLTTVYTPSPSSGSCGWQLVYEHDLNGANIYGNIDDLIEDVNNGKDIRIVVSCHGNCNLIYNQPQRTWMRNDRVYIYDEGSINLGWDDNDDPVFDTEIYKTVFDTSGLLNVWNDDEDVVRPYQYAAKWFTRG